MSRDGHVPRAPRAAHPPQLTRLAHYDAHDAHHAPPQRRRWGAWARAAVAVAAGTGALLLPELADAQQQTFHLDRLEVPGAPDDGVVLFRPVTKDESIFYAQLGLGLSINPLRTDNITNYQPALNASATNVITTQFTSYMSAGLELLDRITLGITLPVTWIQTGNQPNYPIGLGGNAATTTFSTGGPAVADTRLDGRFVVWRSLEGDKAVGVQLSVRIPTGNGSSSNFGGDGAFSALPMVTGEWTPHHLPTFVANLGVDFRHDNSINNPAGNNTGPVQGIGIGDELRWAIGALIPIAGGKFRLAGTIFGQTGITNDHTTGPTFFTAQNTPIEWNFEVRAKLPIKGDRWFVSGSGGTLILPGYGAPDLRLVALVGTYLPIEDTNPHSPAARDRVRESIHESLKDTDGDGIPDDIDACPTEPEDHKDPDPNDGCPAPSDRDGDGIPDQFDKCPDEPEDKDGIQDQDGCPEVDADNDGIPDTKDACPREPGAARSRPEEERLPEVHQARGLVRARPPAGALRDRLGDHRAGQLPDAGRDLGAPQGESVDQEDADRGPHRQPRQRRLQPRPLQETGRERPNVPRAARRRGQPARERGVRPDTANRDQRHRRGTSRQPARRIQESSRTAAAAAVPEKPLSRKCAPMWLSESRGEDLDDPGFASLVADGGDADAVEVAPQRVRSVRRARPQGSMRERHGRGVGDVLAERPGREPCSLQAFGRIALAVVVGRGMRGCHAPCVPSGQRVEPGVTHERRLAARRPRGSQHACQRERVVLSPVLGGTAGRCILARRALGAHARGRLGVGEHARLDDGSRAARSRRHHLHGELAWPIERESCVQRRAVDHAGTRRGAPLGPSTSTTPALAGTRSRALTVSHCPVRARVGRGSRSASASTATTASARVPSAATALATAHLRRRGSRSSASQTSSFCSVAAVERSLALAAQARAQGCGSPAARCANAMASGPGRGRPRRA